MIQVMLSIGGFYRFNRVSQLQLTILKAPADAGTPVTTVYQDDLILNGISLSAIEVPRHQISLGYRKKLDCISKRRTSSYFTRN